MTDERGGARRENSVYLSDEEFLEPKEAHKQVVELIRRGVGDDEIDLIDVGCASGAFLAHACEALRVGRCVGLDLDEELIARASEKLNDVEFVAGSIEDLPSSLSDESFGVCTCLGVMGMFDEIDSVVRNLLSLTRAGGVLVIWTPVNRHPVDVKLQYRTVGVDGPSDWHGGLNVFSRESYEKAIAAACPAAEISISDFEMPFSLAPAEDPLRQWTMRTEDRARQITVGTGQLLDFRFVCVRKH